MAQDVLGYWNRPADPEIISNTDNGDVIQIPIERFLQ